MSVKGKGRKDKKISVDELRERLDALFAHCDETLAPPSNLLVSRFLGVSIDRVEAWRKEVVVDEDGKERQTEYAEALKKLDEYRTDFWLRVGLSNPKVQAFAMFNLKQPHNGGYTDKPSNDATSVEITIKNGGVGSGAFE